MVYDFLCILQVVRSVTGDPYNSRPRSFGILPIGAFLLGRSPAELLAEFRALALEPAVMEKWLWRNAAGLLGLDEAFARA